MQLSPSQTKVIGSTIRTVAASQSKRFFKSEVNTPGRSAVVYLSIESAIQLALVDAGIPKKMVLNDIDLVPDIVKQMVADGYVLGDELLGVLS